MLTESLGQDLRIGVRVLLKEKAFTGLAVLVLALGIGAVTTQYAVVNGVMLRGFSFPNGDRLTDVAFVDPTTATAFGVNRRMLAIDYEELRENQKSFERLTAYLGGSTVNMTVDGQPRRYTGAYVTDEFLTVLGVRPALGRDFRAEDNRPGAEKVAIISHGLWQRDYAAASDIVGRTTRINGKPATIIGVMPPDFTFPAIEELWLPLYGEFPVRPRNDPQANGPAVIGLLRPGVSEEQAQVEVTAIARRFAAAYADTNKAFNQGQVRPLLENFIGPQMRGILLTMLAFCVGVLLIACANVMNMQFGRAVLRARELAVRSSLGATRRRLVRQMLTENLLLASVGAVLGTGLAFFSTSWLLATFRNSDNPPPQWITFDIDGASLAVTIASMVVAAVLSGLVPAWLATRANVVEVLREGGRGNTSRAVNFITRGLVVVQVVVTCFLLVGSLLQLRSIVAQQRIDYGYDTDGLMSARLGLMDGDYPTPEARILFYDRLARELRDNPQWAGAALTSRLRMVGTGSGPVEIDGKAYRTRRDRPNASFEQVSGNYFAVMGQRIVEGRTFHEDDLDSKLPVAIVNEAFARKHFPGASAIGRRFRTGDGESSPNGPWRTIVGVVTNARMVGPFNNPNVDDTGFYVPFLSLPVGPIPPTPVAAQFATILVRPHTGQRPESVLPALRKQVASIDPNLPLYFTGTPRHYLDSANGPLRVIAGMFSVFGVVAVILAAVGIFGVMSFSVAQRRQEIGVRVALGANSGRILRMVLRQGAWQLGLGLTVGLGLSLLIATLGRDAIGQVLYGVTAVDPLAFGFVFVLVTSVGLVASLIPARRATRVDPMIAVRAE